jgi:hypothetical protein
MLAVRAETLAKGALVSGDPASIERAARLCALTRAIEASGATSCAPLLDIAQRAPRSERVGAP